MKRLLAILSLATIAVPSVYAQTAQVDAGVETLPAATTVQSVDSDKQVAPGQLRGNVTVPIAGGEVSPVAGVTVAMRDQTGRTLTARTDESGRFLIGGVRPGAYALTARGKGVFACSAMYVVGRRSTETAKGLPFEIRIPAAEVDYSTVKSLMLRYLPPTTRSFGPLDRSTDVSGFDGRSIAGGRQLVQSASGGLDGRIHATLTGQGQSVDSGQVNVFLIQKGEVLNRVISERDGSFSFASVDPGVYSILALGEAGIGLAGFELVGANERASASNVSASGETFVVQTEPNLFLLELAPLPQAMVAVEEIDEESDQLEEEMAFEDVLMTDEFGNPISGFDQFGNPVGGGAMGGAADGGALGSGGGFTGGGGGGSGGGIGGGLGGLASLAGLAALAGSDNSNNGNLAPPPPASPAR